MITEDRKLAKLKDYTKDEIIEALSELAFPRYDGVIDLLLTSCKGKRARDIFAQHDAAFDKMIKANEALLRWKAVMCEKYGDGKTVKLKDIPTDEIKEGASLERASDEAKKAYQALDKKVRKLTEVIIDE